MQINLICAQSLARILIAAVETSRYFQLRITVKPWRASSTASAAGTPADMVRA
jgi:hypothetical protein